MKTLLLNLTQHTFTTEQVEDFSTCYGGETIPRNEELTAEIKSQLNFFTAPSREEVIARATALAEIAVAQNATHALIGGAPYLMGHLVDALKNKGVTPLFSFTERISSEFINDSGEVVKTNKFVHKAFIEG